MFDANQLYAWHESMSKPWGWPLGVGAIAFYQIGSRGYWMIPNYPSWIIVLLAVGYNLIKRYKNMASIFWMIFLGNWLPYFFINRALFLYHYFPALSIGYVYLPLLLHRFGVKEYLPLIAAIVIVTILGFCYSAPLTYGWTITNPNWWPFLGLI
jgi:dolichyl-phosphate-mannose--protein O-mannosyl transferase